MYIETERLVIRRMTAADLEDFAAYAPDPDRCRMMGTAPLETFEAVEETFQWLLFNEKRFYAIELKGEGRVIGHIEVHNYPSEGDRPELEGKTGRSLSFCVARAYQRRGFAFEALSALIGFLFENRGVDYIVSGYFDFNVPSRELHAKLGFRPMSTVTQSVNGVPHRCVDCILINPAAPRGEVVESVSEK